MLERRMKPKNFKLLVYIFGGLLEIIGFGLLFTFNQTMEILHTYKVVFAIILILGGYLLATSVRKW